MNPAIVAPMERRGHPRLALDLQCHLAGPGIKGVKPAGRTVNISRSGVLVVLTDEHLRRDVPSLGALVRVDIELPTNRYLQCRGRVVRVHASQTHAPLIAVAIQRMEFCENVRKPVVVARNWNAIKEVLM